MTVDGRVRRAAEQREVRRAQIVDAALDVFAAKGYHGTSISDVVQAAGVARGTFYQYFESKTDIFQALVDELLLELRAAIVGVNPSPDAPPLIEQLEATVARILRTLQANEALCAILFREAVGVDADVDRKLNDFYAELRTYIEAALVLGQRLGFVRDDLDTDVAAWCALGTIREVATRYLAADREGVDLDQIAYAVLRFNLDGLRA